MNYSPCPVWMRMRRAFLWASAAVLGMSLSLKLKAQEPTTLVASFAGDLSQPIKVDVLVGQSRVINFDRPYERVSISNPEVAEYHALPPSQLLVNGKKFGQVNLVVWSKATDGEPSRVITFDLYVQANLSLIDNQIKVLFPKENIQLSQANESVVISGSVTRPELAKEVQQIIEAAGFKVVNLLRAPVRDELQVQLQIRVAEVNRNVLREIGTLYGFTDSATRIGINPSRLGSIGTGPSNLALTLGSLRSKTLTDAFIRALYERGALRDLAEPNLIAMNGKKASFLAGGEVPIPVIQSVSNFQNAITVQYKEFGVKLEFTPTIVDENHIQLDLAPEVSSLDFASGVTISGLVIPALRVRRAQTFLELRDGQSFALAGLLDNSEQVSISKLPLLGDIPILGELFKSRRFQRNETELMFLVTVKMVEPLNPDQIPLLPGVSNSRPGGLPPVTPPPSGVIQGESGHSLPLKPTERKPPELGSDVELSEPQTINAPAASSTAEKGAKPRAKDGAKPW